MESEGFLMAAQDQAIRTNSIKKHIDKQIFPRNAEFAAKEKKQLVIS